MYICGDVPQRGLNGPAENISGGLQKKIHLEGAVETKAQVQEAKEFISEKRLFPHFPLLTTYFMPSESSMFLKNPNKPMSFPYN